MLVSLAVCHGAASALRERLTDLQARFAEEYMVDLNGSQAAKRAGSKAENTRQAAYEFLTNPDVQNYIGALESERRERTLMSADKLLEMLVEEADADVALLYDADGNIKPVHEWPMVFRRGLVVAIEVEMKYDRTNGQHVGVGRVSKIKIADRGKIKEMIGRHSSVQAFKDEIGLTGAIGLASIDVRGLSDDQLQALAAIEV